MEPYAPILDALLALQDETYQAFQRKLIPTVAPERVIGVRVPALRKLARTWKGTAEAAAFLTQLPHRYYDEDCLHGLLLSEEKDYHAAVKALERFLPYVDNWAVCDLMAPKAFRSLPPELPEQARAWMNGTHTYTIRFGTGVLLRYYLDEAFQPEYLEWSAAVRSSEYYVNMMTAWYFATALAKQYDAALPYLLEKRLGPWVHNKTIQKAVESYRITPEQKKYLRTLKRKE